MEALLEKLADKLPEIGFDWYARLLPGCLALWIYYLGAPTPELQKLVFDHPGVSLFAAYLIGHVLQSPASFLVKFPEWFWEWVLGCWSRYKNHKNAESELSNQKKVTKAHAEAVCMMSIGLVCFVLAIYFRNSGPETLTIQRLKLTGVLFIIFSMERASARARKIWDMAKTTKEPNPSPLWVRICAAVALIAAYAWFAIRALSIT